MDDYLRQYGFVFLMTGVAIAVPVTVLLISWLGIKVHARPHRPNPVKYDLYECGMETVGGTWERFNVRYYRYALLFLLFDVEVVFLFPWATQAGALGWSAFGAILFFITIMVVGFAYEWRRGGMEWDESMPQPLVQVLEDEEPELAAA